jgi:hypothetical protein
MAIEKTAKRSYQDIPTKVEKVSEELSCELTPVEWSARANELAQANKKLSEETLRKKSVMAQLGSDIKSAEAKVAKLSSIVNNNREQREVTVEIRHDFENGLIIKNRTDTKEEISRREMTTSERQSSLFDTEATDANDLIESRHEEPTTAPKTKPTKKDK